SGGHVSVSTKPGSGSTFRVYLPRLDAPLAPLPAEQTPRAVAGGSETILLVEDEDLVRGLARQILELCGYVVLEAAQGEEAILLSRAYAGPIQLMVTDVVMPHMSGRELAARLAELRPAMKVLYMSGYTDDAILRHGV